MRRNIILLGTNTKIIQCSTPFEDDFWSRTTKHWKLHWGFATSSIQGVILAYSVFLFGRLTIDLKIFYIAATENVYRLQCRWKLFPSPLGISPLVAWSRSLGGVYTRSRVELTMRSL